MSTMTKTPAVFFMLSVIAVAPTSAAAQQQDAGNEVMTTVYGEPPVDLSDLAEGPEVEGFISKRAAERIQVTRADGSGATVLISEGTEIKATGGFLGLGRNALTTESLLNGLPVSVKTVYWGDRLVASRIRLKNSDLKTAAMIRRGTEQRFGEQDAAISQNTAATDALRGRFGDIDQYNIKGTTSVYFDSGKHDLSFGAQNELCAAAARAEAMDNALLLVVGYTDSTGSYEINQALSEKRAGRVVNYLQQQCGWKPYRMLTPAGMAEADPLASNDTEEGKAQNRRVEVNILVSKSVDGF